MTKTTCPRRLESPMPQGGIYEDHYREDGTCSYCGSMNPDTFMQRLLAGDIEVGPTDKSYKVYVRNRGGEGFKQTYRNCPVHPCPDVTDADGKANVNNCTHWVTRDVEDTKFYFQHLTPAQQDSFIQLHNEGKIHYGFPGYLYTTPYFCQKTTPNPPSNQDGS